MLHFLEYEDLGKMGLLKGAMHDTLIFIGIVSLILLAVHAVRGRKRGAKSSQTIYRSRMTLKSQKAVQMRAEKLQAAQDQHRETHGPTTRAGPASNHTPAKLPIPSFESIPPRINRTLSSDDIRSAICILTFFIAEGGSHIFERASKLIGIGQSKLYYIWQEWLLNKGKFLPQCFLGARRLGKTSEVVTNFAGVIRAFILARKLEGMVVEIPDIQRLLKDDHGFDVSRSVLRRAMKKMGFKYGKKTKLMQNKEKPRLAKLRKEYLEKKLEWEAKITARDAEIAARDAAEQVVVAPEVGSCHIGGTDENGQVYLYPRPKKLMFVFLDESYVNRNHSLGYTWYDPDDEHGAAVFMASGKGERLVMLTAITEEMGILNHELLDADHGTLLIFQAKKGTGDYHKNMNGACFGEWLEGKMVPVLRQHNIEAIFVMDNASYHLVPYHGSICVDSYKNKNEVTAFLDAHNIPYRKGRAPNGDTLDQLKGIAKTWLKDNAVREKILVDVTNTDQVCAENGHHVLLTPPYHPELQPIEKLWRNVKMYVARKYAGTRSMVDLWIHVREAFERYGSPYFCAKNVADAKQFEELYNTPGAHKLSVAEDADDSDDNGSDSSSDVGFSSDDDSESEDEGGY